VYYNIQSARRPRVVKHRVNSMWRDSVSLARSTPPPPPCVCVSLHVSSPHDAWSRPEFFALLPATCRRNMLSRGRASSSSLLLSVHYRPPPPIVSITVTLVKLLLEVLWRQTPWIDIVGKQTGITLYIELWIFTSYSVHTNRVRACSGSLLIHRVLVDLAKRRANISLDSCRFHVSLLYCIIYRLQIKIVFMKRLRAD
jgi:hypothetical protein